MLIDNSITKAVAESLAGLSVRESAEISSGCICMDSIAVTEHSSAFGDLQHQITPVDLLAPRGAKRKREEEEEAEDEEVEDEDDDDLDDDDDDDDDDFEDEEEMGEGFEDDELEDEDIFYEEDEDE
ncbi:MAG TPA: hypothetical protein VMG59_07405 [Phycisphaerae bacterium]|nr:hypothetical protein [Phycisphaerae bacterium]